MGKVRGFDLELGLPRNKGQQISMLRLKYSVSSSSSPCYCSFVWGVFLAERGPACMSPHLGTLGRAQTDQV